MDEHALRSSLEAVPIIDYLGIKYVTIGHGQGVAQLPENPALANHIGSQSAGPLFAVGEAAAAGAVWGMFTDHITHVAPLATDAEIKFRRVARGPITATASIEADTTMLLAELREVGSIRFPTNVVLTDEENIVVCRMTVNMYLKDDAG